MKILLDENLPRKLVPALRAEGRKVESVFTLRMQGLDNGRLYQFAIQNFDICFTRDFGFINNVRQGKPPAKFKLLRVTLAQKPQDEFIKDFIRHFARRTWPDFSMATIGRDFLLRNLWQCPAHSAISAKEMPKDGQSLCGLAAILMRYGMESDCWRSRQCWRGAAARAPLRRGAAQGHRPPAIAPRPPAMAALL